MNMVKTEVIVSKIEQINMKPSNKNDSCGICRRKTIGNAVLCKSCGNWIHGRWARIKRVTNRLEILFKCRKCKGCQKNVGDQKEKLHDDVVTMTDFSNLDDRINSGGGCEAVVAPRI